MNNLFSVWLVPAKNDEFYLSKVIADLNIKYNTPLFTPHLTLLGNINIELEKLINIINFVFMDTKSFKIKKTIINQSQIFFKTIFIEFELNKKLKNLYLTLAEKTNSKDVTVFKPHISLIYKTMSKKEKLKIIEMLNIKGEFLINKIVINTPKIGDKDFLNIESWRTLYEKQLND